MRGLNVLTEEDKKMFGDRMNILGECEKAGKPCPVTYNPADWILWLACTIDDGEAEELVNKQATGYMVERAHSKDSKGAHFAPLTALFVTLFRNKTDHRKSAVREVKCAPLTRSPGTRGGMC